MKKIVEPCCSAVLRRTEKDLLDVENDRHGRVAGAHEVSVQGVHGAGRVDSAAGGDQGLAGDLTAEDSLRTDLGAFALERGRVDLLEVENLEELVDGGLSGERQGQTVAGSTSVPSWWTRSVLVAPGALGGLPATTTT
jgi:hypothetical protein